MIEKIMQRIFWYLARKLDYEVVMKVEKHFHYTEITENMPDRIIAHFG